MKFIEHINLLNHDDEATARSIAQDMQLWNISDTDVCHDLIFSSSKTTNKSLQGTDFIKQYDSYADETQPHILKQYFDDVKLDYVKILHCDMYHLYFYATTDEISEHALTNYFNNIERSCNYYQPLIQQREHVFQIERDFEDFIMLTQLYKITFKASKKYLQIYDKPTTAQLPKIHLQALIFLKQTGTFNTLKLQTILSQMERLMVLSDQECKEKTQENIQRFSKHCERYNLGNILDNHYEPYTNYLTVLHNNLFHEDFHNIEFYNKLKFETRNYFISLDAIKNQTIAILNNQFIEFKKNQEKETLDKINNIQHQNLSDTNKNYLKIKTRFELHRNIYQAACRHYAEYEHDYATRRILEEFKINFIDLDQEFHATQEKYNKEFKNKTDLINDEFIREKENNRKSNDVNQIKIKIAIEIKIKNLEDQLALLKAYPYITVLHDSEGFILGEIHRLNQLLNNLPEYQNINQNLRENELFGDIAIPPQLQQIEPNELEEPARVQLAKKMIANQLVVTEEFANVQNQLNKQLYLDFFKYMYLNAILKQEKKDKIFAMNQEIPEFDHNDFIELQADVDNQELDTHRRMLILSEEIYLRYENITKKILHITDKILKNIDISIEVNGLDENIKQFNNFKNQYHNKIVNWEKGNLTIELMDFFHNSCDKFIEFERETSFHLQQSIETIKTFQIKKQKQEFLKKYSAILSVTCIALTLGITAIFGMSSWLLIGFLASQAILLTTSLYLYPFNLQSNFLKKMHYINQFCILELNLQDTIEQFQAPILFKARADHEAVRHHALNIRNVEGVERNIQLAELEIPRNRL